MYDRTPSTWNNYWLVVPALHMLIGNRRVYMWLQMPTLLISKCKLDTSRPSMKLAKYQGKSNIPFFCYRFGRKSKFYVRWSKSLIIFSSTSMDLVLELYTSSGNTPNSVLWMICRSEPLKISRLTWFHYNCHILFCLNFLEARNIFNPARCCTDRIGRNENVDQVLYKTTTQICKLQG